METIEKKNENLQVTATKKTGCQIELNILVSPEGAKAAYKKAIKSINKEVSIPGFRKGKAPDSVVEKNYAKHLEQEWRDLIVNIAFKESLKLLELYPFDEKKIKLDSLNNVSCDTGAEIRITFEANPSVPSIVPKDLTIEAIEPSPIKDEDIEREIHNLSLYHSDWTEVTDRGLEEDDFTDLDIENLENGQFLCQDMRFEAKKDKMAKWMRKHLIGKKTGESVETTSEKEDDVDEASFRPTKCRITIKKIYTAKLPEINDELAKKAGVDTLELLKSRIQSDLEKKENERIQQKLRGQLVAKLNEKYPFDLPNSILEVESERTKRSLKIAQETNESDEDFSKRKQELENKALEEIKHSIGSHFLLTKYSQENKIAVSEQELISEMMNLIMYNKNLMQRFQQSDEAKAEIRRVVHSDILSRKVKDHIIAQIVN